MTISVTIETTADRIKLGRVIAIIRGDFPSSKLIEIGVGSHLVSGPEIKMAKVIARARALQAAWEAALFQNNYRS